MILKNIREPRLTFQRRLIARTATRFSLLNQSSIAAIITPTVLSFANNSDSTAAF